MNGRRDRILWAVCGLILVASATALLVRADVRAETGLPVGGHDFIAYWSANEVSLEGGDPYDEAALQAVQQEIHPRYRDGPQRFWNPPWALALLAPVVTLPFHVAASLWLVISVLAGAGCVAVAWRLFVEDTWAVPPLALGAALLFQPFMEALALGQLSTVLTLCVLGGLLALREGRDVLAGVLLAVAVVKPQAWLLVGVVVGMHVLHARRWAVLASGCVAAGVLVSVSLALHPSVWAGWNPTEGSPTHWHSATIAGWIRAALQEGGSAPTWPVAAVPVTAVILTAVWARHHREHLPWANLPRVLVLSVLVAPYAWLADSTLIWPTLVVILGGVAHHRPGAQWRLGAFMAAQVVALVVLSLAGSGQQHQIVLPALVLLLQWSVPADWIRRDDPAAVGTAAAIGGR